MKRISRENGILFHISALPGEYGIGTMGKEAYQFVDFLSECKVNIWQLLPLNLTSYGDSPYQSPSSTGLNYYLIDLKTLVQKKLLTKKEIESFDFGSDERRVNYGLLFNNRAQLLKLAFSRFNKKSAAFTRFIKEGKYSDFAFFMTMKEKNHFTPWYEWEEKERIYTPILEERIKLEYKDNYLFYLWTQFEFLAQFKQLKKYANSKGISIMGDLPLYLARDSVEAYKYPQFFKFDEKHNPTVVAGVPPDYFNENGQLWGNPIYDWDYMKATNYEWWNQRIKNNFELFDIVRIDHFRGLAAYYEIPFGAENAKHGEWIDGPSTSLFEDKKDLPIVAEDLGFIDDKVRLLLAETGYPGMKILEFAFDGDPKNEHKPSNAKYNYLAYTGTHDNEPLLSYVEKLKEEELEVFKKDVEKECKLFAVPFKADTLKELVHTVVSLCYASPCRLAILPMADLLPLGAEARINTPAELNGINWTFRYLKSDFTPALKKFIKDNIELYR